MDLFIMKKWMIYALPEIKHIIDEVSDISLSEFDYRKEAKIYKIMKDQIHLPNVYLPKVYDNLVNKSVLCLEYINGISLLKFLDIYKEHPEKIIYVIKKIYEIFIIQLFEIGIYSTDPHAGNFLIKNHDSEYPIIVPIDFGQHSTISDKYKKLLSNVFFALSKNKSDGNSFSVYLKLLYDNINNKTMLKNINNYIKNNILIKEFDKMGFKTKNNNNIFKIFYCYSTFSTEYTKENIEAMSNFKEYNKLDEIIYSPSEIILASKAIVSLGGINTISKISVSLADEYIKYSQNNK